MFDLVIRDVMLVDGLGLPPRRGGVAVKDGRIVEVGYIGGASRATVDGDGLALMPGIIDNHTHYDAQITWDPWASPSPALGVTTAIIGNCGFTIAPCRPQDRELVMRNLTQVEGMSLDVLRAGIRWEFESVPQYLDMLERNGAAPWRSSMSRYCGKVSNSQRMPARSTSSDMPSTWVRLRITSSRSAARQGAMVKPQLPITAVVTPSAGEGETRGSQVICAS